MPQEQKNPFIDELRKRVSQMLNGLDQGLPIAATVAFSVNVAREDVFASNAEVLADATRKLPGCNVFAYHERRLIEGDPSPPANGVEYIIYEDWETVREFQAQWDSDHLQKFQHSVGDLLVGPPELRWYYGWASGGSYPGTAPAAVPKTWQKRCYDEAGKVISCKGTGQDGNFQAGLPWPNPRFTDNSDGTVTDNLTKLIWLKDADFFGEVRWEKALKHAKELGSGKYGLSDGSKPGDWRLPNIRELFSLVDYGSGDPLIPAGNPFKNVRTAIYWTNTTLAAAPTLGWMMTLGIGPTVFDLKLNPNRMWPVRGKSTRVPQTGQKVCWALDENEPTGAKIIPCEGTGQDGDIQAGVPWPDPRFTDNADGTVTDNLTGLVWLKNGNPFGFRTWQQALDECNKLASGQYGLSDGSKRGDWRLPNIKEIESLVDYGRVAPCLPDGGKPFEHVLPSSYWTSTTVAKAPSEAMFIILGVGPAIFESKEHPFFVWPVRSRRKA
jgi:quinol monooxygenase YgiN